MREKAGKKVWILEALLGLGLCMALLQPKGWTTVQAKEQAEQRTGMRTLASQGNLLYQDSGEGAGIFAADFSLLREKLASVPEEVFDPAAYGNEEGESL